MTATLVDGSCESLDTLTNYDANVLALSPDGRTLMVAYRLKGRIVCVEEDTEP